MHGRGSIVWDGVMHLPVFLPIIDQKLSVPPSPVPHFLTKRRFLTGFPYFYFELKAKTISKISLAGMYSLQFLPFGGGAVPPDASIYVNVGGLHEKT